MKNLLLTCKEVKNYDFDRMRVNHNFIHYCLSENYKIIDWLNDKSVRNDYKTLLLGLKRYPFISEEDENIESLYIKNYYYLNAPDIEELHRKETEGLAAAFLYDTISISFRTNEIWNKTIINLIEKIDNEETIVSVKHVSGPEHVAPHKEWLQSNKSLTLLQSEILPENKSINLRDDHGRDLLFQFARKLVKSPYVIRIINSLPFNPKETHFIKEIYPDGKIEIVLTWTDEGYGLVVQTTGRNFQETKAIADIIDKNITKR
ncbi:MAG: hypothetical protein ABRQ37_07365 [Candidatus Eremiobacterota bacterium]